MNEISFLLPCDLAGTPVQAFRDIVEIRRDVGRVVLNSIVGETAKADHILITLEIIHKRVPPKNTVIAIADENNDVTEGHRKKKEYC
jgi:hypothetical protein